MLGRMPCRAVVVAVVLAAGWLSACAATAPQLVGPRAQSLPPGGTWLLYVREQPVAEVEVTEPSRNNRVDVRIRDQAVKVTLRHQGMVRLRPLVNQLEGGLPVVFNEEAPLPPPTQQRLRQAVAEDRYAEAQAALEELPREEWVELVRGLWDEKLLTLAREPAGRPLLEQLFSGLTEGGVGEAEAVQAQRILATFAQLRRPEEFAQAVQSPKTKRLPYRAPGLTVLNSTPLDAWWQPDGKIKVQLSPRVFWTEYREEALTLEGLRFFVLDADEVVGVTLYDEGGKEVFAPALILLQVANMDDHRAKLKMLEAAALGFGVGLGTGALMGGGVEASLLTRVLRLCDLAALGLGVAASLLDEHRGWILSRFGEEGRLFLRAADRVNSAVAFYGMARLVMAAPTLVRALRGSYHNYLGRAEALEGLTPAELKRLKDLRGAFDDLFKKVDEIQAHRGGGRASAGLDEAPPSGGAKVIPLDRARTQGGKPPESTAQQPPVQVEEPLAATGTDGKLVPIRRQAPVRDGTTFAGRERKPGAGVTPGGAVPPSTQFGQAPGAGRRSQTEQGTKKSSSRLRRIEGGVDMVEMSAEEYAARKFAELEWSEPQRLPGTRAELERLRPQLGSPPPGVPPEEQVWAEYVGYYNKRLGALAEHEGGRLGTRPKNPLHWEKYRDLRDTTLRGVAFEGKIGGQLAGEVTLPLPERTLTKGLAQPSIDRRVGVRKEGYENVLYVDFLGVDMATVGPGKTARGLCASTKSRNFAGMTNREVEATVRADALELKAKYGGILEVRRPGHPLFRQKVEVTELHLVYDADMVTEQGLRNFIAEVLVPERIKVHFR